MYDGTDGPDGVTVSEGDVINWFSDYGYTEPGFEICVGAACVATDTSTDDGSDGNFHCINGGVIGGVAGQCTCLSCNAGFGGANCADCATGYSSDDCSTAADCVGTSTSTDDGTDGNFYCVNGGSINGTTGGCICTGCDAGFSGQSCQYVTHQAGTMDEFFNLASSNTASENTGNNLMASGDAIVLAVATYKCSDGTCASNENMIYIQDRAGGILCAVDDASCAIDGEGENEIGHNSKQRGRRVY